MKLILYSKPDCHLCEGLIEKLQQVKTVQFDLEIRDINSNLNWFDRYQYEIPVLCLWDEKLERERELPRLSPRSPATKLEELLNQYV
jgi:thiol-disulfide isomerase/thioredoxin